MTATPLQNSLLELYGLVSIIDDRVFGDLDSFRAQFTAQGRDQAFGALRDRLSPVCKRALRKQVQHYVSYTARKAIVQEFTPSSEEQELSRLVADYLQRPNLNALPNAQRQLPAVAQAASLFNHAGDTTLATDMETRKTELLREINQRNLGYFEQEVQKLDAWADDLKLGLEQEIKEIDREIKEVRRTAATSPTLGEKLSWQKKQRELEGRRSKLRKELFVRQDEIDARRNELISQLEAQLEQRVEERTLFTIEWELV